MWSMWQSLSRLTLGSRGKGADAGQLEAVIGFLMNWAGVNTEGVRNRPCRPPEKRVPGGLGHPCANSREELLENAPGGGEGYI